MAFGLRLKTAAIFGGICCGTAAAADVSAVTQWAGKYPSETAVDHKPLWDQPGIQSAMRAAMGEHYFALSQGSQRHPEAPVADNGKGLFAAWTCNVSDDCGGNQMTVYLDTASGAAQVCWRSAEPVGGPVQDFWLADGEASALPINGCGVGERDPFASWKKFRRAAEK